MKGRGGHTMRGIFNRTGFSLIEVNMAILIAAGGLMSLFSLLPGGLRHSVMSQEDLYQSTFASSLLDTISANVKKIDDVGDWNNAKTFWEYAVGKQGDQCVPIKGIPAALKNAAAAKSDGAISDATKQLLTDENGSVWFACQEEDEVDDDPPSVTVLLPTQYFIRLKQEAGIGGAPARYTVSVTSTQMPSPAAYHRNAIYTMDYYFCGQP